MIKEEETNEAGIAIPDMSQERETCAMGKVISTGLRRINKRVEEGETIVETEGELPAELKLLETFNLQKGDILLLKKFDYTKIKTDSDKEYRVYGTDSIIAKISE